MTEEEFERALEAFKARDYASGRWCGECRWEVVEEPPCCYREEACIVCGAPAKRDAFAADGQQYPWCGTVHQGQPC